MAVCTLKLVPGYQLREEEEEEAEEQTKIEEEEKEAAVEEDVGVPPLLLQFLPCVPYALWKACNRGGVGWFYNFVILKECGLKDLQLDVISLLNLPSSSDVKEKTSSCCIH